MGKLRELRQDVSKALSAEPWPMGLATLGGHQAKSLLGPLFACLLEHDLLVRWRAATAFGMVLSRLFNEKAEEARQVMRQLMWRLNEESGNIAWGIPEAFGEILAAEPALAKEYHRVLLSYIHERDCETGDNYLELCPLRRGVYWAIARLAKASPDLILSAQEDLLAALTGEDPESRGLSADALGSLGVVPGADIGRIRQGLSALREDPAPVDYYSSGMITRTTVGAMAEHALKRIP